MAQNEDHANESLPDSQSLAEASETSSVSRLRSKHHFRRRWEVRHAVQMSRLSTMNQAGEGMAGFMNG